MTERRKLIRLALDAEVTIRSPDRPDSHGTVKNINADGILITSLARYEPGAVVDIEVSASARQGAENDSPLLARIQVLRVEGEEAPFDIAAEFLQMDLP